MARSAQLERLSRRLEAIPRAVKQAVQPALQKSGAELVDTMQHLAPVSEDGSHGNPPGALRDSIVMTAAGNTTPPYSQPGGSQTVPENAVMITAGNNGVRYPHLVEYGTSKADAQPYFWPSYRLLKARISRRIKRGVGQAVRKEWKR